MGLPARQQRALETIEVSLRAGAPHLAGMFAIFGRLTRGESRPWREQLPDRSWLARVGHALARARTRGRRNRSLPARRRPVARLLFIGQLMAILAVLGVLIGLGSSMAPAACVSRTTFHSNAMQPRPVSPGMAMPVCQGQPSK